METINFSSKKKLIKYLDEIYPGMYSLDQTFIFDPKNMFKKSGVLFKECGCRTKLCPAGLQRGIKCKRCYGVTKESLRDQRSLIKKEAISMKGFWGSLYYIRIEPIDGGDSYYKIGISKNGLQTRFSSEEFSSIEPIFEIPFKTRNDAKLAELNILREYDMYSIKYNKDLVDKYPLKSGWTEAFNENILLKQGSLKELTEITTNVD